MTSDPKPVSAESVPAAEVAATSNAAEPTPIADAQLDAVAGGISGRVGGATGGTSSDARVPTTDA